MSGITLNFFGEEVNDADGIALKKFSPSKAGCSWQCFDGVDDDFPYEITDMDWQITKVMNSGISENIIRKERGKKKNAEKYLRKIDKNFNLLDYEEGNDRDKLWDNLDNLVKSLLIEGKVAMSRATKMLCRKRPYLIPMLDNKVINFMNKRLGLTKKEPSDSLPDWLKRDWGKWKHPKYQVSFYIRLIREDIRKPKQIDALKKIRKRLSENSETHVPEDASLLRIYEATLYRALEEGIIV